MSDAGDLGALIAEAFDEIPPTHWIVPDGTVRRTMLAGQFEIWVEHALEHGVVHTAGQGEAVAVWFDNTKETPDIEGYSEKLAAITGPWLPRFEEFDAILAANHPHDAPPHHHLALLAVRPGRQSAGLGAQLLHRHHSWLDSNGIPSYLEASSERARDLYLRHGYTPMGDPYYLPQGGPPMFPMWRDPA